MSICCRTTAWACDDYGSRCFFLVCCVSYLCCRHCYCNPHARPPHATANRLGQKFSGLLDDASLSPLPRWHTTKFNTWLRCSAPPRLPSPSVLPPRAPPQYPWSSRWRSGTSDFWARSIKGPWHIAVNEDCAQQFQVRYGYGYGELTTLRVKQTDIIVRVTKSSPLRKSSTSEAPPRA